MPLIKDDAGDYHDSDSFSGSDLLRISHLATRAYDAISAQASGCVS
ncbi:MAG: hypothetical protein O7F17_06610 [Planctomycetota bacterium]|nr:hypothetical protein [Planctomycetota bacterium]